MKETILIAEDDPNIRFGLTEILSKEGYTVATCERGDRVASELEKSRPHLLVLDVMMPGKNGYEVARDLRQSGQQLPILMLTAKGQEMDKVIGLDMGADDYLTKPFGIQELVARIRALLRRSQQPTAKVEEKFTIGTAEVDAKKYQITSGDKTASLSSRELKLLQFFDSHRGEVLSRDQLLNEGWGINYYGTTRTLDQTIVQLRKKIGDSGARPRYLVTVHGIGYKLGAG